MGENRSKKIVVLGTKHSLFPIVLVSIADRCDGLFCPVLVQCFGGRLALTPSSKDSTSWENSYLKQEMSAETEHSKEPWVACEVPNQADMDGLYEIYNKPFGLGVIGWTLKKEDGQRIAVCINACKKIGNPASINETIEALKGMLELVTFSGSHMPIKAFKEKAEKARQQAIIAATPTTGATA